MGVLEPVQNVHVLDVDLKTTVKRLGRAGVGSKELDRCVRLLLFGTKIDFLTGPITTSSDAALSLAEKVSPGWYWECCFGDGWQVYVQAAPEPWPEGLTGADRDGVYVTAATMPLAICLAVLRIDLMKKAATDE